MPKFKYYKEGDSVEKKGQIFRVLEENAETWANAPGDLGEPKYKEVSFVEWADYIPEEWEKDPEARTFTDPEYGQLSLEDGEPVE